MPTTTDALPSSCRTVAQSTGEDVTQLCETGKFHSIPNVAHDPRYATCANFSVGFA